MNERQAQERLEKLTSIIEKIGHSKEEEIKRDTEENYNSAKNQYLKEGKDKVKAEFDKKWKQLEVQKRITRSTSINASRLNIMKARNECVNSLLEEARIALAERVSNNQEEYKQLLKMLLVQGFIKLLDQEVVVRCRQEDENLVQQVLDEAKAQFQEIMERETGKTYTLSVKLDADTYLPPAPEPDSHNPSCSGGVILMSHNGKIRCQNTLDDRLDLTFSSTLPLIRKMLFS